MRQWNVNPELLCSKHLRGEHFEHHMFLGSIKKGISMKGYINKGLVEMHNIKNRHDELALEMMNRGYNHKSEMEEYSLIKEGYVDSEENIKILINKCPKCKERMIK